MSPSNPDPKRPGPAEATRLVHSGARDEPLPRTVNPPIQRGSTVLARSAQALYDGSQLTYGRRGLVAQQSLERALAEMESAAGVRLHPSGLAAISQTLLALLKSGDGILVAEHVYRPTRIFCDRVLTRFGVEVRYFPQQLAPRDIAALLTRNTRLIYLESPGSLSFQMQDVRAIAALARARGLLTLMDNTWSAGFLFRPLEHGVHIALQSLTKYVAGHSDVFMGSAACAEADTLRQLDAGLDEMGVSVSPEDAYLVLRSLRTLPTRLEHHGRSGLEIARWLERQPEVESVLHPGLPSFPDHALFARDYSGASALFGVVLKPVPETAVRAMLDALTLFGLGFSWGGHESLALHCDPQRQWGGVFPHYAGPLLRFHIGLEEPRDLIADLRRGLDVLSR